MNFITTIRFDIPTLLALTEDSDAVERLQKAARAAGRLIDEDDLRYLIQDALLEAVDNRAAALEREVRDAEEEKCFNKKYPLDAVGDNTSDVSEIASAVTTQRYPPFVAASEPSAQDLRYKGPWGPSTVGQVDVAITGDGEMFSSIWASFVTGNGVKMMLTVVVNAEGVDEGTITTTMNVLDKESNGAGFYGRVEHCVTAKTKYAWQRGKVPYTIVRRFLANALKAYSQSMSESFEHVTGAIDSAFKEREDTSVLSPSPLPRYKRARSLTQSPQTPVSE